MGDAIRCPKCGNGDVTCSENPHNHVCHACGYSMLPVMDAPDDEMVAKPTYEHALPEGYFRAASGDTLPFFDQAGRAIVLRFWPDGTVTWQLRGRDGEVLEPEPAP